MTPFERELASALEPARAPESLWYRVAARLDAPRARRRVPWLAALLAPACLAAFLLPLRAPTPLQVHEDFFRDPGRLGVVRCQPAELHNWLARSAGLAVNFTARPTPDPDRVQLLGARRLQGGRAAVFYRVDGYPVTLLIARGEIGSAAKRIRRRNDPRASLTLFEWGVRGQTYTLISALPDGSRKACGICHVGGIPPEG